MNFEEAEAIIDNLIEDQDINNQKVLEVFWDVFYGLKEKYGDN